MIDKDKLRRRFSRNARQYDKYARVQKIMGDSLLERIKDDKIVPRNILEIGCGTGYVTRALLDSFPQAKITAVDIAPGMIEYVDSMVESDNVKLICGDIEDMDLNEKYDLIISNATFQWFNDFSKTLEKLVKLLNPNGVLSFSTFGEMTFTELNNCFKKVRAQLKIYEDISPGQSFFSLEELKSICSEIGEKSGLEAIITYSSQSYEYEYFDCCKDFLFSVKKIGANNSQSNRKIMDPSFIEKVMETYDRDYEIDNKVRATYHNLFIYMKYIQQNKISQNDKILL
ncbi:malonyl-ACP O-methyltransferase BioC [Wukongibacter sp. M2B1]|uniref:malonyl-ACP O-methyltransferase BioC n=1 Tax=Wukongibacter sp. M2B1 TaxID=3088895 RepID=UPI003D7A63E3